MYSNSSSHWLYGKLVAKEKPDLNLVARNLGITLPPERPVVNSPWYRTSGNSLRSSLKIALTHSSYLNENPNENLECNERLEFLGDAVLGLVIANELYTKYPDLQEGALTQIRANVVNTKTLARVARNLKLGEHLLLGSGEEKTGGLDRDSNLANAFEAVVAAVGIGGGYNGYNAARDFCLRVLREEIGRAYHECTTPSVQFNQPKHIVVPPYSPTSNLLKPTTQPSKRKQARKSTASKQTKKLNTAGKHPKSALQEISQARHGKPPVYRITKATGKSNAMTFTAQVQVNGKMLGSGSGSSKKSAETAAAQAALKALT